MSKHLGVKNFMPFQKETAISYLRYVINNVDLFFFCLDRDGIFTYVEGKGLATWHFKSDDVLGKSVYDVCKEFPEIIENVKRALEGEKFRSVINIENRIYETTYNPIISNGAVDKVVGIAYDITDNHIMERDLKESEERFRTLAENIPGVIYLCNNDEDYSMLYINSRIKKLTGYSKEEFESGIIAFSKLIHPKDINVVRDTIDKMIAKNKPFEILYRIQHKNGKWRWVKEHGIAVTRNNGVNMLEGFITDVTENKMIEDALRESESKFRTIVEKSNDAIYILKRDRFVMVNSKFQEIFGYTDEEVLDESFSPVYLVDESSIPVIESRRKKRELGIPVSDRYSFTGIDKLGKKIDVEVSLSNIDWEGDPAVLGILRDVSLQKRLEEQLIHSQKMEAVGRLAGGLAHDLNNIFTAISGYAELLGSGLKGPENLREYVGHIISASERATSLIRHLLAFSRKQIIQPEPVNLNDMVMSLSPMLERILGEDITMEIMTGEDSGSILIDPSLLEQVVMNIVINARDAMPTGGKIIIETFDTELSQDYDDMYSDINPGRYVVLAISDSGAGMTEEIRRQIFEPFFTTKEKGKGSGLGLSTVYGIIKQSGGNIWCYSEINKGTTFKVYFPRVDQEAKKVETKRKVVVLPRGDETILIAEDEESVRLLCKRVLSDLGYNVLEAKCGDDGVKVANNYDGTIDLIIADMVMPNLNGKEMSERIRKIRPSSKLLYISGYTDNIVVHRGVVDKGVEFIQKPFTPSLLASRVRDILDGKTKR